MSGSNKCQDSSAKLGWEDKRVRAGVGGVAWLGKTSGVGWWLRGSLNETRRDWLQSDPEAGVAEKWERTDPQYWWKGSCPQERGPPSLLWPWQEAHRTGDTRGCQTAHVHRATDTGFWALYILLMLSEVWVLSPFFIGEETKSGRGFTSSGSSFLEPGSPLLFGTSDPRCYPPMGCFWPSKGRR